MNCPKCKKPGLRKLVYVAVDAPAECYNLSKTGLRSAQINIEAVNWDKERFRCPNCFWLSTPSPATRTS